MSVPSHANVTKQSVQQQLKSLFEFNACSICHDVLCAPVKLPCGHLFCSQCIRRYLLTCSKCPHQHCLKPATSKDLLPDKQLDAALEPIRQAIKCASSTGSAPASTTTTANDDNNYLVIVSSKTAGAKGVLSKKLRKHKLPFAGNVQELADRYTEFVIRWNANIDSAVKLSESAIVEAVSNYELSTAYRSKRGVKPTKPPSFFEKSKSTRPASKGSKSGTQGGAGVNEEEVIEEGDDFDTLIRKTKARKMRLKRERELVDGAAPSASKRPRIEYQQPEARRSIVKDPMDEIQVEEQYPIKEQLEEVEPPPVKVEAQLLDDPTESGPYAPNLGDNDSDNSSQATLPPEPIEQPEVPQTSGPSLQPAHQPGSRACAVCSHIPVRVCGTIVSQVCSFDIAPSPRSQLRTPTPNNPQHQELLKNNSNIGSTQPVQHYGAHNGVDPALAMGSHRISPLERYAHGQPSVPPEQTSDICNIRPVTSSRAQFPIKPQSGNPNISPFAASKNQLHGQSNNAHLQNRAGSMPSNDNTRPHTQLNPFHLNAQSSNTQNPGQNVHAHSPFRPSSALSSAPPDPNIGSFSGDSIQNDDQARFPPVCHGSPFRPNHNSSSTFNQSANTPQGYLLQSAQQRPGFNVGSAGNTPTKGTVTQQPHLSPSHTQSPFRPPPPFNRRGPEFNVNSAGNTPTRGTANQLSHNNTSQTQSPFRPHSQAPHFSPNGHPTPRGLSASLSSPVRTCTPEEIEHKRQIALQRKRERLERAKAGQFGSQSQVQLQSQASSQWGGPNNRKGGQ